jgi:hypothetical protein
VGAGGGDPAAAGLGRRAQPAPQVGQVGPQLVEGPADRGANLHLGQVELVLDGLVAQLGPAVGQHRAAGRDELARARVDEQVLLFDAEGEVLFSQHDSRLPVA